MRRLVLDYAAQHHLAEAGTGLVDIGWTGRMAGSLIESVRGGRHEPTARAVLGARAAPATGWTDPERVASYMYNTATGQGLQWRVPDAPFVMETFCMGDHGIVSGYRADADGRIEPVLLSPGNDAAEAWGLRLYRLDAVRVLRGARHGPHACRRRRAAAGAPGHGRLLVPPEPGRGARVGSLSLRQRPGRNRRSAAGPAVRRMGRVTRGDRAWLAGSLALSTPDGQAAYLRHAPEHELAGAPETDLRDRNTEVGLAVSGDLAA